MPSHVAPALECLQPQKYTVPVVGALNIVGAIPVPLCEPSQKGCPLLRPQAHQA